MHPFADHARPECLNGLSFKDDDCVLAEGFFLIRWLKAVKMHIAAINKFGMFFFGNRQCLLKKLRQQDVIRVHKNHIVSLHLLQSVISRNGYTVVFPKADMNPFVRENTIMIHIPVRSAAAVIDDPDFKITECLCQNAVHTFDQQFFLRLVAGHDHTNFRHTIL